MYAWNRRLPAVFTLFALTLAACSHGQPRTESPSPAKASNPCAAKNACATKPANPCAAKNACAAKPANPCAAKNVCAAKPANPCAAKNVCAAKPANPCAAKNVCAAKPANPCAAKNACAAKPANPCAAKNVCAAKNPCAGGAAAPMLDASKIQQGSNRLYTGASTAQLVAYGKQLWEDPKLSKSGALACANCHVNNYGLMQATFSQAYPHKVAMAKERANLNQVNSAEMVQLCMVVPMNSAPLPWSSRELAALSAYVQDIQKGFKAPTGAMANPCAGKPMNPCASKPANPCAPKPANPCRPR